jgi:hypothetical protein
MLYIASEKGIFEKGRLMTSEEICNKLQRLHFLERQLELEKC